MLRVNTHYVAAIHAAETKTDLQWIVQAAVELEHATIPAYLCAAFSLKPGINNAAREIILSIANEEMLHMSVAANLLNAIGGSPEIDKPGFIPLYPGKLPMAVDDGLTVRLQKASRRLINETFMRIEEPEQPLELGARRVQPVAVVTSVSLSTFPTIGDFYAAIKNKLCALGNDAFRHPSSPQVVDNTWFPSNELFAITDVDSACRAIDVIVDQGEGTTASPLEQPSGRLAHYYRFEQIVQGRRLEADSRDPGQYAFAGEAVPLDPEDVWNLYPDPKCADYGQGSRARMLVEQFNYSYTALLRALHQTFNGAPQMLDAALGLMYELRLLAPQLVSTPVGNSGMTATPTFEYSPVAP